MPLGVTALGLCLALAADPDSAVVFVPATGFTLAWTHSIERVRWEEDYRIEAGGTGPARLLPVAARIQGSGAGMEPPPDAVWRQGWYHYTPGNAELEVLRLSRSAYTPDYELCTDTTGCRSLGAWLPSDGGVTLLRACTDQAAAVSSGGARETR